MSNAAELRAAAGSLAFGVLVPGSVAGFVPYLLTGWEAADLSAPWEQLRHLGAAPIAAGLAALLISFAGFIHEGLGTPAPVAPTERVVVGGLYRYVRNPMYLAVAAIIVGQAILLARPALFAYAAAFGLTVHAFVRFYEEPTLRRQFGPIYDRYRESVPGWWPRRLQPPR